MRLSLMFLSVITMLVISACSTSPTGRSQLILLPDGQMNELGVQSFAQMKQKGSVVTGAKLNYVRCISNRLLSTMGENPQTWEVQVFNDASANAFALPGKKIGVNTGMIKLANRDQLAAVIGHEIAHVKARHGAERLSMNMGLQTLNQLLAQGLAGSEYAGLAQQALAIGGQVGVLLPYSRTHESEADNIGLVIMAKAGFNPTAGVTLWQAMQKASKGAPPELLSTHPSSQTRINALQKQLSSVMPSYQANPLSAKICAKP